MSDTENKTKNTEETTTVDTAPYMKKAGQDENKAASNKTEMLIPAVLLLVSAIVIGATFYSNKDRNALAQEEDTPAATVATEVVAIVEAPASDASATQEQSASNTETETTTATEESDTKTVVNKQNLVADTETAPVVTEVIIVSEEKVAAAAPQTPPASHMAAVRPAHVSAQAPYHYNPYSRQQAQARAKQHMEMLQQRRQAYEREMQDRRAQYETAMKAQQEKRAKIAEARKTVFQRAQKDRQVINQKIQAIHQQIAKLHEEIHQLMSEYRRNAVPAPMHSM